MKHPQPLLEKIKVRLKQLDLNDQTLSGDFAELEKLLIFNYEVIAKCPVAIYLSDAEQRELIWANERASEVLGRDWKETGKEGEHFFDENLHPQDQKNLREKMKHFEVFPNHVHEGPYRVKDEDGKQYQWKYGLMAAFAREEGKPPQFMSASFDLSEALQDRLNFYESTKEVAKTDPPPAHQLTSREKEILKLIARGFTMREVGEQLKISHHTAGTHRKNLFKKTQVNKTSDLIRFAMQNGLD